MNADISSDINNQLNTMTEDELKALRRFLFEERIAILNEKRAQEQLYEKFMEERLSFREEMKAINSKVLSERKRLKEEQSFFDKKLMILQNGFAALEMDRKAFEKEKKTFYAGAKRTKRSGFSFSDDISFMFAGVTSYLGLRKRYKDLIKIFHPDNLDGDSTMAVAIREEFEKLKERF